MITGYRSGTDRPGLGVSGIVPARRRRADTADPASIATATRSVVTRHPELNVLVAMAGIMRVEDWHDPASFVSSAEEVITTNVLGPVRLIGALIERLRQQPSATIMTVSSGPGFTPLKVVPSCNASKAAVHLLSESIRLQLADTGVGIVEPGQPAWRGRNGTRAAAY